jgi:exo-beta-1,3-glucanase (GH17 family)
MTGLAYLRHPLLLLAAVAVAIAFIWYVLGVPVQMPPSPLVAGQKLDCVSYAPAIAAAGEGTAEDAASRIDADLAALAPLASCIRTYRTGAILELVPEIARRHGLTVLQGIDLGRGLAHNRAEIERAIALSQTQRPAIQAFIVGSEVLTRRELDNVELAELIREVRERTGLPISYADRVEPWQNADRIVAHVDFITLHVPLYDADFPVAAGDAARHVATKHAELAARFPDKEVVIGEAGWPSAGRMREAALPSPVKQALVLHELIAAANAGRFQINIFAGIDGVTLGNANHPAGAHWGLLHNDTHELKFRWGGAVSSHPLWFIQAVTGILLAFVVFAAGFLAARSTGPQGIAAAKWEPVAIIALAAGAFIGWAVAELPIQSRGIAGWAAGIVLLMLTFIVPPVSAAAVVRRVPFEAFSAVLDPDIRRSMPALTRSLAWLLVLVVLLAVQSALVLAFDPAGRAFPFAALTGPAVSLLVLSIACPAGMRRESYAEAGAAVILAASAVSIVVNETLWNWQALWFAAVLCALALACWRAPGVQRR